MMQKMTNACPNHAKNVPFDKKRKPGRPQLAPLAFIRASNFTSLLEIEDDAELVDDALNDNNINNNLQLESQFDIVTSGLGDSLNETNESNKTSENSLIPLGGINFNHISNIQEEHFDPTFNDF
jgi:hypothetical protein